MIHQQESKVVIYVPTAKRLLKTCVIDDIIAKAESVNVNTKEMPLWPLPGILNSYDKTHFQTAVYTTNHRYM